MNEIRELRRRERLSQQEFAELIGVPVNTFRMWDSGLRRVISQQQLAASVGAASKAVVYQWESGKRKPSPVFWLRIERLQRRRPNSLPA